MTLTEASEKEKESFGHYLAYSAMIPVRAYGTLKKRLEETGMDRLFDEIEMPLVYALYDMETGRNYGLQATSLKNMVKDLKLALMH